MTPYRIRKKYIYTSERPTAKYLIGINLECAKEEGFQFLGIWESLEKSSAVMSCISKIQEFSTAVENCYHESCRQLVKF
jgi:hypothetical protein